MRSFAEQACALFFNVMTISSSFWLQDTELLPSNIQKQNLDFVKKLDGKSGREVVEFVAIAYEPSHAQQVLNHQTIHGPVYQYYPAVPIVK